MKIEYPKIEADKDEDDDETTLSDCEECQKTLKALEEMSIEGDNGSGLKGHPRLAKLLEKYKAIQS